MIKRILAISSVFFVIFFLTSDRAIYIRRAHGATGAIRICVVKNIPQISLNIKGRYKIFTFNTDELIEEGRYFKKSTVSPLMSGVRIGKKEFRVYGIKLVPKKDSTIYVGKKRFRGSLDIIRTEDLKLLVINHVDVEDYLRGVLYHEVSHWWPMEVLKAQAITARTYAIYQSRVSKAKDYDLTDDVYSQVYGGKFSERWRTDRAIRATRNKVLTFNGKIFPTYYHATCGGHTEDALNLWNIDLRALKGIKCSFCRKSPHYHWSKRMSLSDIESKLKKSGYSIGKISSIKIAGRFPSNRAGDIEIKSSTAVLIIPAKNFRKILGNDLIRSTNFKLNIKGNAAFFEGYGWGHGVGMCQWGAYFMAKRHFKAIEILRFYYPGTKVEIYN